MGVSQGAEGYVNTLPQGAMFTPKLKVDPGGSQISLEEPNWSKQALKVLSQNHPEDEEEMPVKRGK